LALDTTGNLYATDSNNNCVRKITPGGVVSTLAGGGGSGYNGSGYMDGAGTGAAFYRPMGLVLDPSGNVYVADQGNNMIRKITPSGVVSTLAGGGGYGFYGEGRVNATGTAASFYMPTGLTIDNAGNLFVADAANDMIREVTPLGVVTTLAGSGNTGNANGAGATASFAFPIGAAWVSPGILYIADQQNGEIRKITY
jgi:streptogramin lyase